MANDFASVTYPTARGADLLAQQMNGKLVDTITKNMPFFQGILTDFEKQQGTPWEGPGLPRTNVVSGGKQRVRWMGAVPSVSIVGSGETASTSFSIDADRKGAAEVELTHFHKMHSLSYEESVFSQGNNQWVDNWLGEEMDMLLKGFLITMYTAIVSGTGDQSKFSLGSLARALDSADDYGTYLGITRGTNTGLQSITASASGTTAANLLALVDRARAQGGNPRFILVSQTNFTTLRAAAGVAATYNVTKGEGLYYDGGKLWLGDLPVLLDGYMPNKHSYIIDPDSWQVTFNDQGFRVGKPFRAETVDSALGMHADIFMAVICRNPRFNARFTDLQQLGS